MKTLDEFINENLGKSFDYDKVAGIQCVDLIKSYLNECFGIKVPNGFGNAINYFTDFENKKLLYTNFIKITNTPEFIPEKGDIIVWNEKRGKGAGHIAICTGEGTTREFYSWDLNWSNKKIVQKVKHDYKNILGVLRFKKKETKINYRKGELVYVPVLFTGARTEKNSLVDYNKNQFWISNEEFLENQNVIIGTICFVKENSLGVAFHYWRNGIKREFQIEIPNKDIR